MPVEQKAGKNPEKQSSNCHQVKIFTFESLNETDLINALKSSWKMVNLPLLEKYHET